MALRWAKVVAGVVLGLFGVYMVYEVGIPANRPQTLKESIICCKYMFTVKDIRHLFTWLYLDWTLIVVMGQLEEPAPLLQWQSTTIKWLKIRNFVSVLVPTPFLALVARWISCTERFNCLVQIGFSRGGGRGSPGSSTLLEAMAPRTSAEAEDDEPPERSE